MPDTIKKELAVPTIKKAHEINLDDNLYGTFAEIGAGQEVARHFFQAGHASNTVAKAISAYDMVFSDEIYGKEKNGRYVCQSRVKKMLDHEFDLLQSRLKNQAHKKFFTFANTVATNRKHGWLAVRFQTKPGARSNDVILHVNMKDNTRLQQTEALGHLGVNLLYACFFKLDSPKDFISSLNDNLSYGRVDIDMISFDGPDLEHIDNRLMCLELVEQKMASAVIFDESGQVMQAGDLFFDHSIFVQRGAFRPVTKVNLEISEAGLAQFQKDFALKSPPVSLFEITMSQLHSENQTIDRKDFLDRVDCLAQLGCKVILSDFVEFYRFKQYLRQWTPQPIAMVMGGNQLDYFFDENQCEDLDGGIFEGAAYLFDKNSCVYVFPYKTDEICATTKSYFPSPQLDSLYRYLLENKKIIDLSDCDEVSASRLSSEVRNMMNAGDPAWESLVPQKVVEYIKKYKLFQSK